MTGNEIKVKISAENMDFLRKMQDCIQAISKVDKAAKSASSGAGINKTAPLPSTGASTSAPLPSGFKGSPINAGTGGFFDGFLGGAAKASMAIAGLTYALGKVKDIAAAIVMPGFEYTKEMETAQLGIAGILTSMTNLDGKAMDFSSAMGISADIMKKLQMDAILTSATTEEMVTTFRALLAPGIGAGMNVDEIREFTKVGVNAVKAMGLNSTQFVQELRDLVQGGIQASSSTLATSLGLTDADIKKAKASSEGLFKFLMNRMQGFKPMAEEFPKTLTGKLSMLGEFSTLASAKITESFTPEIKAALDLVTGLIATVNNDTKQIEFNPKILEFVDMLKNGADEVIEIFGTMNEKTGKFEVNPSVLSFFDELGDGLKSLWDLAMSLGKTFDQIFNDESFSLVQEFLLPVLADLWSIFVDITDIIKDVITVIGNLADAIIDVTGPFHKEFSGALVWAVEKLKDFIHYAKQGWDMLAKLSGKGATKEPEKKRSDWRKKSEEQEKASSGSTGNITAKNESRAQKEAAEKAEKERIKASQKTLKEALKYWKTQLDAIQKEFKRKQEELKMLFDQGAVNGNEYALTEVMNAITQDKQEVANLENQKQAVIKAEFTDESQRTDRLASINTQLELVNEQLKRDESDRNELIELQSKHNQITPQEAVKRYGLDPAGFDLSSQATKLGQRTGLEVGQSVIAEAGKIVANDTFGYGENDCTKFVINVLKNAGIDKLAQEMGLDFTSVVDLWVPTFYQKAKEAGLLTTPESGYVPKPGDVVFTNDLGHVVLANGKGGAIGASGSRGIATEYPDLKTAFPSVQGYLPLDKLHEIKSQEQTPINQGYGPTKSGRVLDDIQRRLQATEKAMGVLQDYNAMLGDVSTIQIEQLNKKYNDTIVELQKYPAEQHVSEAMGKLKKLIDGQKAAVNFAQVQHDLENANEDLADAQNQLFTEFETGSKSSADVANEFAAKFHELFDTKLQELNKQLEEALKRGNDEDVRKIRRQIKESIDKMVDGFKALLDKIDAQTNEEINRIQLRKDLTSGQKDDLVEEARQRGLRTKIGASENQISEWNLQKANTLDPEKIKDYDLKIADTREKLEQLNYELSQTPTYIDKIELAGKQGLEDGLNSFFYDLAMGCKNVSDAFKDLANSILQSITKVITSRLTQQLMGMFGLGTNSNMGRPSGISGPLMSDGGFFSKFADGGNINDGGKVSGPGTGTSDSILAYVGNLKKFIRIANGEYIINAAAVQRFGTRFMDYINSGMIPPEIYQVHERYASGGSLSGTDIKIPSASTTNHVSVPVTVNGANPSPAMSSEMRREIEDLVIRIMRKYS